jgi:hypothetical protein
MREQGLRMQLPCRGMFVATVAVGYGRGYCEVLVLVLRLLDSPSTRRGGKARALKPPQADPQLHTRNVQRGGNTSSSTDRAVCSVEN